MIAIDAQGNLAAVHHQWPAFKCAAVWAIHQLLAPVIVDNEVGAAVSTGLGEE